ncbi:hypothetical protein SSX86_008545 [Deinandra increscens subsp. villosa]|uniref:Zinc finger family protein n=1 Tax=Deinandra increscens subsp. villosa TaxID=3103831 RepID=A0AAP0DJB4_9ASTR
MGRGWRRAFCTTIPRDSAPVLGEAVPAPSPRLPGKLAFFKNSSSNPSTPRLHSRNVINNLNDGEITNSAPRLRPNNNGGDDEFHSSVIDNLNITPRLRCRTNSKKNHPLKGGSNPSSPRSPFSIFKTSLGFSRSNCGLCFQSVKTGHKTAIFTAECSHTFHFPCISQHVKQLETTVLACPVCKTTWRDASFLAIQSTQIPNPRSQSEEKIISKPKLLQYHDDEPLRTPRLPPGNILPIPEEEEEDNITMDEEFQGFFANPVVSSSELFRRDFKNVEVMLVSEVAVISSTQSHETYAVVLRVKAPPPPHGLNNASTRRAPIDLVAVLDVSASMGGAKLQMLKRAMRLVISSLGSVDRLSIVAFSDSPKRLLPLRRMHPRGQRSARRIIDQLVSSRGSSGGGEALRNATKVLEDRRERNPVASIILLSDGHENMNQNHHQSSNKRQPASSHTRFAHVEIPVHTLEKTHEPAENAFTKCVGGLLSVVAQDLRVELHVAAGSDPAEISAVYSCNGKPTVLNSGSVRFGDLYAEEEREVLVELRVPRSNTGSHHVLSARCCYNDPATQEVIYGGEKALLVPRPQSVRSSTSTKIHRLRSLFIATRAVAESRLLVEQNNLTTAHLMLSSARALLMQSASAEEFVKGLESELEDVERRVEDGNGEPLTPTSSAWRAAERLAKVAVVNKSLNRVSDLHGFENARF